MLPLSRISPSPVTPTSPPKQPATARDIATLRRLHAGRDVIFVPTMGGLHAGHLALVHHARALANKRDAAVCVSVFVNPLQFGPAEDYDTYPRQLTTDLQTLAGLADTCFTPSTATIYPVPQEIQVSAPSLGSQLCGQDRPWFFTGMLTVVLKLFSLVRPRIAVFGSKDYQQLVLVRKMVTQLHLPIRIDAVNIVREDDGLALSSRNVNLNDNERKLAPALYQSLTTAAKSIARGTYATTACTTAREAIEYAGLKVIYVECRTRDLEPWTGAQQDFIILGAAKLGATRLIDNVSGSVTSPAS